MEYECGPMLLYSLDKIRMVDFLSDVFEFDVDVASDDVVQGRLFLRLCQLEESKMEKAKESSNGIVFSFHVKSEDELKSIINKFNFFIYRRPSSPFTEKLDLKESENETTLTITDIDQRHWRFQYQSSMDH